MRLYLSSVLESEIPFEEKIKFCENLFVLFSFAYKKNYTERLIPYCKDLLLDSGAFTIMMKKNVKNTFNPIDYCRKYAEFIKNNKIDKFMELDIESVFGFEVYKDCLHCLQDITGKDPIYVFHKWRGLNYFKELVKQKNYIALGDVSVGSGSREIYKFFPWFINEAHKNNCKVHGLAFTALNDLNYMNFDSIDSSSWTAGARFARISRFDGHSIQCYNCRRTEFKTLPSSIDCKRHDLPEWKKLSQYFDTEMEPVW